MKTTIRRVSLLTMILVISQLCLAQAPAGAPAGTTGLCNDGTYYSGANKRGACKGHQGVKEWYGAASATSTKAAAAPAATSAAPAAPTTSPPSTKAAPSTTAAAPGGGPGQVWLNTESNVYHCPGTKWYGKTKAGAYMTEAEAKAKGAHPDHGKACSAT
jgi:hypothetical protein